MLEIKFNEPASLGEEIGKYRPAGDRQSLDLLGNRRHYPQTSPQGNIALIASKLAWGKYLLRKRPHRCQSEKTAQQDAPRGYMDKIRSSVLNIQNDFQMFYLSARYCVAFMFLYAMLIKNSDIFANKTVKIKTKELFIWITTFIDWKCAWKGEYIGKQFLERGNCAQKEKSILMAMWTRHPLFPNSVITHRSSVFLPTPCFLRRMTGRITSFEMADDKAWWSTDNSDCSLRFNP